MSKFWDEIAKTHQIFLKTLPFDEAVEKIKERYFGIDDDTQTETELLVLKSILGGVKSILEIGAGYGRVAKEVLSHFPVSYTIVDIEPALTVARKYLDSLPVTYCRPKDSVQPADLTIAISVLSELDDDEVKRYIELSSHGKYVFLKDIREAHQPREIRMESYHIPETWKVLHFGNSPSAPGFFDALYEVRK